MTFSGSAWLLLQEYFANFYFEDLEKYSGSSRHVPSENVFMDKVYCGYPYVRQTLNTYLAL